MPSAYDLHNWAERSVLDANGKEIGHADGFYTDDRTGEPAFVLVRGGRFGIHMHFAPLVGASLEGDAIKLAWDEDTVNDAPRVGADDHLSPSEEQRLFQHYGLDDGHGGVDIVLTRVTIVTS
jgi:hypothetical protein